MPTEKNRIVSFAARVAWIVACLSLLAGLAILSVARLEYCGQPETMRQRINVASALRSGQPTLAPPRNVVVIHVQADQPDLQIDWVEN